MSLLHRVPENIVQSIRAFRPDLLQQEAGRLGQHFLYVNCGTAKTRCQVMKAITQSFGLPRQAARDEVVLAGELTQAPCHAGQQPGFVIVLDQLPVTSSFDNDRRERLLDVFREAADFWHERKVAFRVFYSCQIHHLSTFLPIMLR